MKKTRIYLNEDQQKQVVTDYLNNNTAKYIYKKFNISDGYLRNILSKNNIKRQYTLERRKHNKKYYLNEKYFDIIDTESKAYFLGFLMADGWINYRKTNNVIGLRIIDLDIIEKLKHAIETNAPIKTRPPSIKNGIKRQANYELLINSKYMIESVAKYGLINKKAHRTYIPNINEILIRHFIRGYFDGDGCIYLKRQLCSITSCSFMILDQIQNLLKNKNILRKEHEYISTRKTYKILTINGQKESLDFLDFIYLDTGIYMERKYQKYLLIKNKSPEFYFGASLWSQFS